jgi:hypothetical protein
MNVVPDPANYILYFEHHQVVHTEFREPGLLAPFVKAMKEERYHLPTDPPDGTFKPVEWQRPKE